MIPTTAAAGYDCFAPLLHVPSVLGQTAGRLSSQSAVSVGRRGASRRVARRSWPNIRGRKIGIVWRGSPTHQADSMRSIPLADFAPLGRLKGVHVLQPAKGPAADELNTLAGRLDVVDLGRSSTKEPARSSKRPPC